MCDVTKSLKSRTGESIILTKAFRSARVWYSHYCSYPSKSKTIDCVGQHIGQQASRWIQGWEIGVHVRTLPMRHSWHDAPFDVREYVLPRFAIHWRRGWQNVSQVTRGYRRVNASGSNVRQIIGNVIHHFFSWQFEIAIKISTEKDICLSNVTFSCLRACKDYASQIFNYFSLAKIYVINLELKDILIKKKRLLSQ